MKSQNEINLLFLNLLSFCGRHNSLKTLFLVKRAQNFLSHGVFTVAAASCHTA